MNLKEETIGFAIVIGALMVAFGVAWFVVASLKTMTELLVPGIL